MSTDSVWDVQEEVDKLEQSVEENQGEMIIEEAGVKEEEKEQVAEPMVEEKNISEEEVEDVMENNASVDVENVSEENNTAEKDADAWKEYTVKQGDTLVAICKIRYGSTAKMQEICEINNIKNADYIAPGQKIYLP